MTFTIPLGPGCNCCQTSVCGGSLSGTGVVNISRSQYLALYNGGTLSMTVDFVLDESWSGPPDAPAVYTGTASGSNTSSYSNSCSGSVSVDSTGPRFVRNPPDPATYPISDNELSHTFSFLLGKDGNNYQVKYTLTGSFVGTSGGTGYPILEVNVPGGDPGFVGTWSPGGAGNAGYANNSSLTITVTISSSAP